MMIRVTFPLVVAGLLFLTGCSGDEGKKEQGAIDRQAEQTAKAAVEAIRTPIDKARTAADQHNDQSRALKEQAGEQ